MPIKPKYSKQLAGLIVLASLLGTGAACADDQNLFQIVQKSKSTLDVVANNVNPFPVTAIVTVAGEGMDKRGWPKMFVVQPNQTGTIATIAKEDGMQFGSNAVSTEYRYGSILNQPMGAVTYLPWRFGEAHKITQSDNGPLSTHNDGFSEHAIDIAMDEGTPVTAAKEGIVAFAFSGRVHGQVEGGDPGGNLVGIYHKDGTISQYGHLSEIDVQPGQRVAGGQIIGLSGNTGLTTGPHLHFAMSVPDMVAGQLRYRTIPVNFITPNNPNPFMVKTGEWYANN